MNVSSIASIVVILALSGCAHTAKSSQTESALIHSALQGTFVGIASEDRDSAFEAEGILHVFEPLTAPQFGEHVLFYQIIVDGGASPASQRKIFVLEDGEASNGVSMSAYILGPDQAFDPADAEAIAALDPGALMSFPDPCDFSWSATETGFEGVVDSTQCAFEGRVFKGTVRAQMTYNISGDDLLWEEALFTGDFTPIVTTDGLQKAVRSLSQ